MKKGFFKFQEGELAGLIGSGILIATGETPESFADGLRDCYLKTCVTAGGSDRKKIRLDQGLFRAHQLFKCAHNKGARVIFIGNGGSAAISSHLAIDYTKNAGIRSMSFNDSAALTCMSNDFGYEEVFSKQLEYQAHKHDVVVLISSSGTSANILSAASQAMQLSVVTLSGMLSTNPLRGMGQVNFFVPAGDYGLIEITHLSLLHTITSVPNLKER
jgi:D-sedoheptulose 7-phosphate isomerase